MATYRMVNLWNQNFSIVVIRHEDAQRTEKTVTDAENGRSQAETYAPRMADVLDKFAIRLDCGSWKQPIRQ
jgi:hypothetical protein